MLFPTRQQPAPVKEEETSPLQDSDIKQIFEQVKEKRQEVTGNITEKGINLEETDHATMKAMLEEIDSTLLEKNASKLTQQILEEHLESLQTILASL